MSPITIVKLVLLALIVTVPFIDYTRYLKVFDITIVKVMMLLLIAGVSFYNMETAILLTILFFLILINSNTETIKKVSHFYATKGAPFVLQGRAGDATTQQENFVMTQFPDNDCKITKETLEPANPISFFVDDKIKPYENYIKLITDEANLVAASNGKVL